MDFIKSSYNKILDGIQSLKDFADSTQKAIDTTTAIFSGAYNFLEPIFSFLPWEVILLLVISSIFLSWVNGLFPSTPKWNYSAIVVFLLSLWAYTESTAYPVEGASWFRIFRAGFYLLLPVYFLSLVSFFGKYAIHYFKKKRLSSPKNLDDFLVLWEKESRRLLATGNGLLSGDKELGDWKEQVRKIQNLLESVEKSSALMEKDLSRSDRSVNTSLSNDNSSNDNSSKDRLES